MGQSGLSVSGVIMLATAGIAATAPAGAREPLGISGGWGAFRDARPVRCFAIAEPAVRRQNDARWRPFLAVTTWPALRLRAQIHVRLRRVKKPGTPVMLTIDRRRFLLASGQAEAWAPDAATDAAIVAAMRGGFEASVAATDLAGRRFADIWVLRGAATAIDAAALGCARLG